MKLSEQWLREWTNPSITIKALAEQLTMAGLEVESILPVAGEFSKIVIGHVLQVEQHPDADRLRVCQVDVGQNEPLSIVCGAANVRATLKVPVAMIGAVLPGNFTIKAAKLRGVPSQGMICSMSELGLAETSQGIMELPEDAPIGVDFRTWLQLDDTVLDLHLTPNRGDCLSVVGIAREIATINQLELAEIAIKPITSTVQDIFDIELLSPDACPYYVGRIIRYINPTAKTPLWMIERLRRSGIRVIHPVVDVTNYVLLEYGQPLHAFDAKKLTDKIIVRYAKSKETLTLLDGQTVTLDEKTLVIADRQSPQALAGIMGGLASSVTEKTTDIFLEAAFFNPLIMAGRARCYGLNTDASYRFERGVDPTLPRQAIERATQLLLAITGGEPGPITEKTASEYLPPVSVILLRSARIAKILGTQIEDSQVESILTRLGMQLQKTEGGWQVTVPTYRFDIILEEDLIEELIRIIGYEKIPVTQSFEPLNFLPQAENNVSLTRLRQLLVDRGYHEAITYSFVSPRLQQLLDPDAATLLLKNPLSNELSSMRTSLWPGLLNTVVYNQNRQQLRVRLFETGLRFPFIDNEVSQQLCLSGVITGEAMPLQWASEPRSADFFDIKADVQALISVTGQSDMFLFAPVEHSALHPGQSAAILKNKQVIGYVGALHPKLIQELSLIGPVYLFEIQLESLLNAELPIFQAVSKFPAIRRDISFVVSADIPAQAIINLVRVKASGYLADIGIFDVYQGKGVEEGYRSLALMLVLQHPARTWLDDEVNALMDEIITALKETFAVRLRE
jgi:phenylalanyl-tRNA synthetase beta chain